MRQIQQRSAQTKLSQIAVECDALESSKHFGEVCRRAAGRRGNIGKLQWLAKVRDEKLFRPANEAPGLR